MGKVTILEIDKDPISKIGRYAGVCWNTDISDPKKNYKRGLDCIKSGHGRLLELVNVEVCLEGYSARVIREWYTHIGCLPTRLQASTRYIDYGAFDYIVPPSIKYGDTLMMDKYKDCMTNIQNSIRQLTSMGVSTEDAAYLLPLGMTTKIIDKRNLRNLLDMEHTRLCTRTLWEFRELLQDLNMKLWDVSDEWQYIVKKYFLPKCAIVGYCTEKHGCGKYPKKGEII